jgi:hypothetical protein
MPARLDAGGCALLALLALCCGSALGGWLLALALLLASAGRGVGAAGAAADRWE